MKLPIHKILPISFIVGVLTSLPCHAAPTSAEAAELAKAKAVIESHTTSPPELNEAIEKLTIVINKNPNIAEAYCYRGELYESLRKPSESFNDFNKAIKVNPKLGRAYIDRGIALFFKKDFPAAINDLDKAIENGEKTNAAYLNRGACYQQLKQFDKAILDFTASSDAKPIWPAYVSRAISYLATNKEDLAIKDFDAALAIKDLPSNVAAEAHEKRGYALAITNRLKEALNDFTAAADCLTGEAKGRMIFLRGAAQFKLGDKDAAEADRKLAKSFGYPKDGPEDKPRSVSSTDQMRRIEEAIKPLIEEARRTLPAAKEKYLKGLPAAHRFFVTTKLKDDENHFEQVFVRVDGWSGTTISGTLGNQVKLHGFKQGDALKIDEKDVLDWTIAKPDGTEEGNLIGKFLDNWKG